MIAVDTNIIVRLLTQDDEQQYNKSLKLFQEQDIFVPETVLLEAEWVLRFAYHLKPNEICEAFRGLLGLPNVYLSNGGLIGQTLQWHEQGLDFADALHLAHSQTQSALYTFDAQFIHRAKGLTKCQVQQPPD